MIIRSHPRPQTLLQAIVKPCLSSTHLQTRSIHRIPQLGINAEEFEKNGVAGFLSKGAFKENWTNYQSHLCDYLNLHTQGTPDEILSARAIVNRYARTPEKASLFNHASMAVNNLHFFNTLSTFGVEPSPSMLLDIKSDFDSFDNLRLEMLETADAMFGNGFVWLMKEDTNPGAGRLRILATYNAGSPFREAHYRQQSRDMATELINHGTLANHLTSFGGQRGGGPGGFGGDRFSRLQNTAGSFGDTSGRAVMHHPNALLATPILGLCVWQHMWIPDYGLLGKRQYLANWWRHIDWGVVQQTALQSGPARQKSPLEKTIDRAMSA